LLPRAHGLGQSDPLLDRVEAYEALAVQQAARLRRWSAYVHQTPEEAELAAIRRSNETGLPFGGGKRGQNYLFVHTSILFAGKQF
jgi:hypothetical protein